MWMGLGWPVWVGPGGQVWPARRPPPPGPGRRDRVLSRVRHPSCTPDQVDSLLEGMSRRQLRRLWAQTTEVVREPLEPAVLANVVALRANLLDRLDPDTPSAPHRKFGT